MFCPNCGKEMHEGAGFCTWCGANVRQRGAEEPEAYTAFELAPTSAPTAPPTPKRRRGALIAVVACSLLVIAGAAGYLLWSLLLGSPIAIDEKNFPNPAVRSAVSEQLDPDGDGKITREEAAAATQLAVRGTNDVSGLGEFFPNLTTLSVDAEQVEDGGAISIGDLPELTRLEVANATVDSIGLSENTGLEALTVSNTPITGLDVSTNTQLEVITVSNTPITSLDLSNNTQLTDLTLTATGIGELDLSANTALESLQVDGEGEGTITLPETETLTSVAVPENRPLSGIEGTGLREVWDVTGISVTPAFFGDASERADIERDGQGKITSVVENNNRGTDTYEFSYDDDGNLVSYSYSALDSDDVTISYNEDGTIASAQGTLSSRRYTYDEQGRVATMTLAEGGSSSTTTFAYDDAGNLVSELKRTDGATGHTQIEYAYDEAGNLTRRVERDVLDDGGSGSIETGFAYEYDDAGNCIRTTISSSSVDGGVVDLATFEASYDEAGRITRFAASVYGNSEPTVETFTYDDRGALASIEGSQGGGYNYEFEYRRRLVAKDAAEKPGFDFVSDPMSGAGLGQNLYYNYCTYFLMPPDYVGTNAITRLSMTICDI